MADLAQILDMLERDGALELLPTPPADAGDTPWPRIEPTDGIAHVDHSRLFPDSRRITDRGREDFEIYGDDWELDRDTAASILGDTDAAGAAAPPAWDVWAWYQPI